MLGYNEIITKNFIVFKESILNLLNFLLKNGFYLIFKTEVQNLCQKNLKMYNNFSELLKHSMANCNTVLCASEAFWKCLRMKICVC